MPSLPGLANGLVLGDALDGALDVAVLDERSVTELDRLVVRHLPCKGRISVCVVRMYRLYRVDGQDGPHDMERN